MTGQAATKEKNFFANAQKQIAGIGQDARKQFDKLTEKGQSSQKELTAKLRKNADDVSKQVKQAKGKAVSYIAGNLRQAASRIERIA